MEREVDHVRMLDLGKSQYDITPVVMDDTDVCDIHFQLLQRGNSSGLTFISSPSGITIIGCDVLDDVNAQYLQRKQEALDRGLNTMHILISSLETDSKNAKSVNQFSAAIGLTSRPYYLALSDNEQLLAVAFDDNLWIFEIGEILEKRELARPFIEMNCIRCMHISWKPQYRSEDTNRKLLAVTKDKSVHIYDCCINHNILADIFGGNSGCWSPRGEFLAVGTSNGDICIFSGKEPHELVRTIKPPIDLGNAEYIYAVHHIHWADEDLIFAGYKCFDESLGEELVHAFLHDRNNVYDLDEVVAFTGDSEQLRHQYFSVFLQEWQMFFIGCSLSADIELLVFDYDLNKWEIWRPPEKYQARLPMDLNDDDSYLTGLQLNLNASQPLYIDGSEYPPAPILLCTTTSGILVSFALLDLSVEGGIDFLITPHTNYSAVITYTAPNDDSVISEPSLRELEGQQDIRQNQTDIHSAIQPFDATEKSKNEELIRVNESYDEALDTSTNIIFSDRQRTTKERLLSIEDNEVPENLSENTPGSDESSLSASFKFQTKDVAAPFTFDYPARAHENFVFNEDQIYAAERISDDISKITTAHTLSGSQVKGSRLLDDLRWGNRFSDISKDPDHRLIDTIKQNTSDSSVDDQADTDIRAPQSLKKNMTSNSLTDPLQNVSQERYRVDAGLTKIGMTAKSSLVISGKVEEHSNSQSVSGQDAARSLANSSEIVNIDRDMDLTREINAFSIAPVPISNSSNTLTIGHSNLKLEDDIHSRTVQSTPAAVSPGATALQFPPTKVLTTPTGYPPSTISLAKPDQATKQAPPGFPPNTVALTKPDQKAKQAPAGYPPSTISLAKPDQAAKQAPAGYPPSTIALAKPMPQSFDVRSNVFVPTSHLTSTSEAATPDWKQSPVQSNFANNSTDLARQSSAATLQVTPSRIISQSSTNGSRPAANIKTATNDLDVAATQSLTAVDRARPPSRLMQILYKLINDFHVIVQRSDRQVTSLSDLQTFKSMAIINDQISQRLISCRKEIDAFTDLWKEMKRNMSFIAGTDSEIHEQIAYGHEALRSFSDDRLKQLIEERPLHQDLQDTRERLMRKVTDIERTCLDLERHLSHTQGSATISDCKGSIKSMYGDTQSVFRVLKHTYEKSKTEYNRICKLSAQINNLQIASVCDRPHKSHESFKSDVAGRIAMSWLEEEESRYQVHEHFMSLCGGILKCRGINENSNVSSKREISASPDLKHKKVLSRLMPSANMTIPSPIPKAVTICPSKPDHKPHREQFFKEGVACRSSTKENEPWNLTLEGRKDGKDNAVTSRALGQSLMPTVTDGGSCFRASAPIDMDKVSNDSSTLQTIKTEASESTLESFIECLEVFYKVYDDSKLAHAKAEMLACRGREREYLESQFRKYKVCNEEDVQKAVNQLISERVLPKNKHETISLVSSGGTGGPVTGFNPSVKYEPTKLTDSSGTFSPFVPSSRIAKTNAFEGRITPIDDNKQGNRTFNADLTGPKIVDTPVSTSGARSDNSSVRERLIAFYKIHNPSKLANVDDTLQRFKGKEDTLFKSLAAKYKTSIEATQTNMAASKSESSKNAAASPFGNANVFASIGGSKTFAQSASGFAAQANPQTLSSSNASSNSMTFGTNATTPSPFTAGSFSAANNSNAFQGGLQQVPQQNSSFSTSQVVDYREKLVQFYQKYNPSRLNDVDTTLLKYKGQEARLFSMLERKYITNTAAMTQPATTANAINTFGTMPSRTADAAVFGSTSGNLGQSLAPKFGAGSSLSCNAPTFANNTSFSQTSSSGFGAFAPPTAGNTGFSNSSGLFGSNIGFSSFAAQQPSATNGTAFGNANAVHSEFVQPKTFGASPSFTQMRS